MMGNLQRFFYLCCFIVLAFGSDTYPYIYNRGNFTLGAIFNVHFRDSVKNGKCGEIDPQCGFMNVEAFLFAVDKINKDPNLIPRLKMGVLVYDTCGYTKKLRDILVFVNNNRVQGIVGPQKSDDAMMTSIVMDIFGKAVVSYSATSVALHDRLKYGNFYRTVSSDDKQVQVMVDLALEFRWTYVGVLNSEGTYGNEMSNEFKRRAGRVGICIPKVYTITKRAKVSTYRHFIESILSDFKIKVIFLFLTDNDVKIFLHTLKQYYNDEARHLTLIAGDTWGSRMSIIKDTEGMAVGSITVQQSTKEVPEFREHFLSMNTSNHIKIPWFQEFWESTFNCSLNSSKSQLNPCSGKEKLTAGKGYFPAANVRAVINSVYAFAHVFTKIINELCKPQTSTDEEFKSCIQRKLFRSYYNAFSRFRNLRFKEPFGDKIIDFKNFDSISDDYDIFNIQTSAKNGTSYVKVGRWKGRNFSYTWGHEKPPSVTHKISESEKNRLEIDYTKIRWKSINYTIPLSICSLPCRYNEIFVYKEVQKCCWSCKRCLPNERIRNNSCTPCPLDHIPDPRLKRCTQLPIHHVSLQSLASALILSLSAAGFLCTLFVAGVFLKNFNMRSVRASGRELCLNILAGIAIVYVSPALFLLEPTSMVCGAQRFVLGLGFSICYASLFLKTNRIYRIFSSAQTSVVRPTMVSPKSQVFMAIALSAVQLLLGIVWVQGEPPQIITSYPKHRQYVIKYCEMNMYTLALNLSYSSILMIISTWFAFKTRNFPKNYNEAKHIGFTMYSSCFALGVFMPIFFFLENDERTAKIYLMCAACEVIATINLLGLFGPKVKLILLPAKAQGIDPNIQTTEFESTRVGIKFVTLPKMKPKE